MRADLQILVSSHLAEASDPITALLTRDWAALGGWSLAISIVVYILVGAVREWWVPGVAYRRVIARADKSEAAIAQLTEALNEALSQNGKLLSSSEVIEYVLKEILPGIKAKGGGTS